MHPSLNPLPRPLLNHLGAYSRLHTLMELPQVTVPLDVMRQQKKGEPYRVNIDAHGLTLTLQCTNPKAEPDKHQWGLHGITLNVSTWDADWPTGLNPHEANIDDVMSPFAPDSQEVFNMPPMLCFPIQGIADQTWSVVAEFDEQTDKLKTFTLLRIGEWRELQPVT